MAQRKRLDDATLGRSINIAKVSGLAFQGVLEDLNHLNTVRIDAVHRAQAPDYSETLILLEVGGNCLESSVRIKGASAGTDCCGR